MIADHALETASSIATLQLANGMIPWFEGGHADPWNHVEAAMALSAAGLFTEAERAYAWLAATQRPDGAWHTYYLPDGSVEEPRLDTNLTAYVATGAWQHYLATGDRGFLEWVAPVVEAAISFVLRARLPAGSGEIAWSVDADGSLAAFALVAASSSLVVSLRAAGEILGLLDGPEARAVAEARAAAVSLGASLRNAVLSGESGRFAAKDEYAMDWYYPVLAGILGASEAGDRLDSGTGRFLVPDWGCLCQSHRRWVTAAETAECAIAQALVGRRDVARSLLDGLARHRQPGGGYLTGLVWPEGSPFPVGERSTYSAAAVVLAEDVLACGPTAWAFGGSCTRP